MSTPLSITCNACGSVVDLEPTGVLCPRCEEGEIVPVRGRYGPMYACERRRACGFWMTARPTGFLCGHPRTPAGGGEAFECEALLMEGTATIPERCSDRECPHHRPAASEDSEHS